jgi:hypothetical protein
MSRVARHRVASWSIFGALLLSLLPAAALQPAAQAEGRKLDQVDQTSANPNEEIVYIDGEGYIRVLDVEAPGTAKTVQFRSPDPGWRNAALGDFNNDGDMEIVAVRGTGPGDSFVAIYDPVVASGQTVPGQEINGVPWKQIVRFAVADKPELAVAGNFDTNVDGDEILIVRETASGESDDPDDDRVVIFKQSDPSAGDGSAWIEHFTKNFGENWDRASVGNVDAQPGDEVVLVEANVAVHVYQPAQNFRRLFEYGSDCRLARDAALGQFFTNNPLELVMVARQRCGSSGPQDAFRVYSYTNNVFPENWTFGERFDPEPRTVFMGDITGNGDDEAILLRQVVDNASAARLIVRGNGDDQIISDFLNGLPLAADNGYREGDAGDIDGDGKDEIVIIRDNNIRYYPDSNSSAQAVDFATNTNRRTIAIGDLDSAGATAGPFFAVDVAKLELEVNFGFETTGTILLKNGGTEASVPFFASSSLSQLVVSPSSAVAPGKSSTGIALTWKVDARGIPIGTNLQATISIFDTSAPAPVVTTNPLVIPVTIKVKAPPFEAIPAGASTMYIPCEAGAGPRDLQLTVSGLPGSELRDVQVWDTAALAAAGLQADGSLFLGTRSVDGASLMLRSATGAEQMVAATGRMSVEASRQTGVNAGFDAVTEGVTGELGAAGIAATNVVTYPSQVPWITAISVNSTVLPAQLTLTVDPSKRGTSFEQAGLVLIGPSYDVSNPIAARSYPIVMVCSDSGSFLPIMRK